MQVKVADEGRDWVQVSVVGAVAKEVGKVMSIMAFEGRFEFGVKEIDKVVSVKTTGDATDATETVTDTPSRLGVGKRSV